MENSQRDSLQLGSHLKNRIAQFLLQHSHAGVLTYGAHKEASLQFGVCRKTSCRIWKDAVQQLQKGKPVIMKAKVRGYGHKDKLKLDSNKVRNLSVLERSSICKMALKLDVSKTTLGRWVKEKQVRSHINAIKPALTDMNKIARLKWCPSQLQPFPQEGMIKYITKSSKHQQTNPHIPTSKPTNQPLNPASRPTIQPTHPSLQTNSHTNLSHQTDSHANPKFTSHPPNPQIIPRKRVPRPMRVAGVCSKAGEVGSCSKIGVAGVSSTAGWQESHRPRRWVECRRPERRLESHWRRGATDRRDDKL